MRSLQLFVSIADNRWLRARRDGIAVEQSGSFHHQMNCSDSGGPGVRFLDAFGNDKSLLWLA